MDPGISKGSRIGLKGSEDLGHGYAVVFNLETGFYPDEGAFDNTKDRLFNRNAYLGLKSPYGEVRFGRQGALGLGVNGAIFLNIFTPFGNVYNECQELQVINHQVMRADNMIRYESPSLSGLKLYGEYSNGVNGDDAVTSSKRDRFAALGATYRRDPLRLVFVADNYFYKNNGKHFGRDDSQTYNFGIRYALDDVTLYGAYQYGDNVQKVGNQMERFSGKDKKSSKLFHSNTGFDSHALVLGAKAKMLGGNLKLQTGYATGDNDYFVEKNGKRTNGLVEADVWQVSVGYDYPLSKRTYLYGALTYIDRTYKQDGDKIYATEGEDNEKSDTVKAAMFGICHSF